MSVESPYLMTISLSVLDDLGINLYSNAPAVLGEVVANAWDADATKVSIVLEGTDRIIITDNGHGMNLDDVNKRYLCVGYKRREEPTFRITPLYKRKVMGRKGIGKLALFSIADTVEIHTLKNGERNAFRMSAQGIRDYIEKKNNDNYRPQKIIFDKNFKKGTKIILTGLKKRATRQTEGGLRKRLARRFSIIGPKNKFNVDVNGKNITLTDRDYYHKMQYLWVLGDPLVVTKCKYLDKSQQRLSSITVGSNSYDVTGWIGSVARAGDLGDGEDNLNKIVLMVRGKLAQEDILEDFTEGGIYTKYLIGEIHADFLDIDENEDIATSGRQEIIKDEPRYEALKAKILEELKNIQRMWTEWRNDKGEQEALKFPAIDAWYKELSPDNRRRAKSLFGKINQLTVDSDEDRKLLLKHGVLAFETMRYKENLDALENISPQNIGMLSEIFLKLSDIEATLYHQIVEERIRVIETLQRKVDANVREKLIQQHIFKELWLLDPSWERATETPYMEQRVMKEFGKINAKLLDEEKKGRLDIKYTTTSKKHVIVELKRADRRVKTTELIDQVDKYKTALQKILNSVGQNLEQIEVVCVVGKNLIDWDQPNGRRESSEMLKAKSIRVVLYDELINNAQKSYKAFIDKKSEAGRINRLLQSL